MSARPCSRCSGTGVEPWRERTCKAPDCRQRFTWERRSREYCATRCQQRHYMQRKRAAFLASAQSRAA